MDEEAIERTAVEEALTAQHLSTVRAELTQALALRTVKAGDVSPIL